MQRLKRLDCGKNCFMVLSSALLLTLLAFLVFSNYTSQKTAQEAFFQQWRQEAEKRASSITYFWTERKYDVKDLASSYEIKSFYQNKALGMSMAYGLQASLDNVDSLFEKYIASRRVNGDRIYQEFLLVDTSKRLVTRIPEKTDGKNYLDNLPELPNKKGKAKLIALNRGNKSVFVIAAPFFFKDKLTGYVLARVKSDVFFDNFLQLRGEPGSGFVFLKGRKGRRLVPFETVSFQSAAKAQPRVKGLSRVRLDYTGHKDTQAGVSNKSFLMVEVPVQKTPFSLRWVKPSDKLLGGTTPLQLLGILVTVILVFLGGNFVLMRTNNKNLALHARVQEAQKHKQEIEEVNDQLRREVDDRRQAEQALRHTEEKYRAIFENAIEGIFQSTLSGRLLSANPAFARMFGYSGLDQLWKETSGEAAAFHLSQESRKELLRALQEDGSVYNFEYQARRRDGRVIWASVNASLMRDSTEEEPYIEGIVDNVTQKKEAEQALVQAKEQAEAANRAKSEFLANMSHEIRTPMNGVMGMADFLYDTELSSEQRDMLSVIRSSAAELLQIIDDVLDFSKIEAGHLEIHPRPVNVERLCHELTSLLGVNAKSKGLELLLDVDGNAPKEVMVDPVRLRQILTNLVGNAIKFTDDGRVELQVENREGTDPEGRVSLGFCVRDTGVGISEDKIGYVFESFAQADGSYTRHFGGTGLGLSISNRLVKMMGGEGIFVESEPGKGSTFSFVLDLEVVSHNISREESGGTAEDDEVSFQGLSVLVAEDNGFNQKLLQKVLQTIGVKNVDIVEDGLQAVEKIRSNPHTWDVVLMDLQMPELDGIEATKRIRGMGVKTPIVALTAHAMDQDRKTCENAGMDMYVAKPCKQNKLKNALRDAVCK